MVGFWNTAKEIYFRFSLMMSFLLSENGDIEAFL